ncbi:hypothetical protein [Nocardia farcinica]|uniref:Uncharacterized protein n=1 Tax=Nocardia farcinica (strain IFM 10152) TaxID=247156 RepID=Q5YSG6_NOCFA|nr:hypothetical protein [Nocardia farcinica]BAD58875.1 hypothetical protein NFA_40270 [Nocardia farcinica IFM 10152]
MNTDGSRGLAQLIPATFLQHRSAPVREPLLETTYARAILLGLQRKHIYEGTVPEAEVARRRTRNRAARKARRANRNN